MKAFQQNLDIPLFKEWNILGALANVSCWALDVLKCDSLIEWSGHFDQIVPLFRPVLDSFGRKKLDKTGFIQFLPFCPEETGFWTEKNPTLVYVNISVIYPLSKLTQADPHIPFVCPQHGVSWYQDKTVFSDLRPTCTLTHWGLVTRWRPVLYFPDTWVPYIFFRTSSRYHRIFTLSGLFRTCQAPGLAVEVDPIAHFGHFRSHLATCTW